MFLLPVLPYLTDTAAQIESSVRAGKDAGVDFVIFGGLLTLKAGRQQSHFLGRIKAKHPKLLGGDLNIYPGHEWGQADKTYYDSIYSTFNRVAKAYKMPRRVPPALFQDLLDENDRIVVLLEHIDYFLKIRGPCLSLWKCGFFHRQPEQFRHFPKRPNCSGFTGSALMSSRVIHEILEAGRSALYSQLCLDQGCFSRHGYRPDRKIDHSIFGRRQVQLG